MKAFVDKASCIGCGLCIDTCPAVFEMGSDDKSLVKVDTVPPETEGPCREAADMCPGSAIKIKN